METARYEARVFEAYEGLDEAFEKGGITGKIDAARFKLALVAKTLRPESPEEIPEFAYHELEGAATICDEAVAVLLWCLDNIRLKAVPEDDPAVPVQ